MAFLYPINYADQKTGSVNRFSDYRKSENVPQFNENFFLWAQGVDAGIMVVDLKNKILFANPFVAKLTQYSQSELGSLCLDLLFKVSHKSEFRLKDDDSGEPNRCHSRRFKAQIIGKEKIAIAVKGTSTHTILLRQPAIILFFKAIENTDKKEKALKYGIQKMRDHFHKKNHKLSVVNRRLQQLQKVLNAKEDEINKLTNELMETNYALSALARRLDNDKKTYELEISRLVISDILPIVKTLQTDKKLNRYNLELNLLESYIGNLSPEGLKNQGVVRNLTEAEGQIATLIKKGMTSKNIANLLCISNETVRTHRKNIRKKLNIQNTDINLRTYLNQSPNADHRIS